jgi:hypothetical protein
VTLDLDDLRLAVYRDLARTGRAPTTTELAARLDSRPRPLERTSPDQVSPSAALSAGMMVDP